MLSHEFIVKEQSLISENSRMTKEIHELTNELRKEKENVTTISYNFTDLTKQAQNSSAKILKSELFVEFLKNKFLPFCEFDFSIWHKFKLLYLRVFDAIKKQIFFLLGLKIAFNNAINPILLSKINSIDELSKFFTNLNKKFLYHCENFGQDISSETNFNFDSFRDQIAEQTTEYLNVQVN